MRDTTESSASPEPWGADPHPTLDLLPPTGRSSAVLERPHSYVGYSHRDRPGSELFYSTRYNRAGLRHGAEGKGSLLPLRPNKSSNDLSAEAGQPFNYRDLLAGSPSLNRDILTGTPPLGKSQRDISPYRPVSVATNRPHYNSPPRQRTARPGTDTYRRDSCTARSPARATGAGNGSPSRRTRFGVTPRSQRTQTPALGGSTNSLYQPPSPEPRTRTCVSSLGHYGGKTSLVSGQTRTASRKSSNPGVVTFNLPDPSEICGDGEENSLVDPFLEADQAVYGQFNISAAAYRRMSAPELPPIMDSTGKGNNSKTPRGDKRKTSTNSQQSTGSKASLHQISAAVNSKTYYNRKAGTDVTNSPQQTNMPTGSKKTKKKRLPIPRNHSDSSLKALAAANNNNLEPFSQSLGSGSTSNSYSTSGGVDSVASRQVKYLTNAHRALSWCATENSGSQSKLETLFEGQNSQHNDDKNNNNSNSNNINNNNLPPSGAGSGILENDSPTALTFKVGGSCNSINNVGVTSGLVRESSTAESIPPRSVSMTGLRSKDDSLRLAAMNKKLLSEYGGDEEVGTVEGFLSRGRMRRSSSENKLGQTPRKNKNNINNGTGDTGSKTGKTPTLSMSRNLSVDRIDRLTSKNTKKSITTTTKPAPGSNPRLRRVSSVSALNSNTTKQNRNNNKLTRNSSYSRLAMNDTTNQGNDDRGDEEEELEASTRLVEWLNVVNNIDEYDTDPKDTIVEYTDEPPQTDTAVHLVYGED